MAETQFYYAEGNQQRGPFTLQQLASFNIAPNTLVWYAGLSEWTPASQAPLTAHLFRPQTPPAPAPAPAPAPNYGGGYEQQPNYGGGYDEQVSEYDRPSTYLAWAIISTILCWPFGIPAIVFAARVNRLWSEGYYDDARNASRKAKTWALVATILGGVFLVIYIIYIILVASAVATVSEAFYGF